MMSDNADTPKLDGLCRSVGVPPGVLESAGRPSFFSSLSSLRPTVGPCYPTPRFCAEWRKTTGLARARRRPAVLSRTCGPPSTFQDLERFVPHATGSSWIGREEIGHCVVFPPNCADPPAGLPGSPKIRVPCPTGGPIRSSPAPGLDHATEFDGAFWGFGAEVTNGTPDAD